MEKTKTKRVPFTAGDWKQIGPVIFSPSAKAIIASVSALRATSEVRFTAPDMFGDERHEIDANARLIAESPEMFDALELALARLEQLGAEDDLPLGACPACEKIRAIIARVEGTI